MRGSIPPANTPSGNIAGQVQPFMPGDRDLFKAVLSRGYGGRANKKIASSTWFIKRDGDTSLAARKEVFCRKVDRFLLRLG